MEDADGRNDRRPRGASPEFAPSASWRRQLSRPPTLILSLLVLALLWPAWRGLHAPTPQAAPRWDGTARTLYLRPTSRSESEPPTVRLAPGQPYLAVIIPVDPWSARAAAADFPIVLTITRDGDGQVVWNRVAMASQLWDGEGRYLSLLVPASGSLTRGDYTIRAKETEGKELFLARWRVAP